VEAMHEDVRSLATASVPSMQAQKMCLHQFCHACCNFSVPSSRCESLRLVTCVSQLLSVTVSYNKTHTNSGGRCLRAT
jgi:hypothetical protein